MGLSCAELPCKNEEMDKNKNKKKKGGENVLVHVPEKARAQLNLNMAVPRASNGITSNSSTSTS